MNEPAPSLAAKRKPAALLALIPLTGGLGIHKFYLGYTRAGIVHLLLGLTLLGVVIGVIEAIIYFTMSDEQFSETYLTHKRGWF